MFVRQTFDLGGETQKVDASINQFAGSQSVDRLVVTLGKFSVVDIFDTNKYTHDPRGDFLNWALIDTGTFDYAADAWGYTYGAAAEWHRGDWTLRGGVFDLSVAPNSIRCGHLRARPGTCGGRERCHRSSHRPFGGSIWRLTTVSFGRPDWL